VFWPRGFWEARGTKAKKPHSVTEIVVWWPCRRRRQGQTKMFEKMSGCLALVPQASKNSLVQKTLRDPFGFSMLPLQPGPETSQIGPGGAEIGPPGPGESRRQMVPAPAGRGGNHFGHPQDGCTLGGLLNSYKDRKSLIWGFQTVGGFATVGMPRRKWPCASEGQERVLRAATSGCAGEKR
jgi:hypothetical protein